MKTGQFDNISNEEYHRGSAYADYLSRSDLIPLLKSPAHYKARQNEPKTETPDMVFGSACHDFILQDDTSNIKVGPDVSKKTNKWKEFLEENQQFYCISPDDLVVMEAMKKVFRSHKYAYPLIAGAWFENTFLWEHAEYEGVFCKVRPDILRISDGIMCDYKTSKDADPDAFAKACVNYGYDIQSAYYPEGVRAITGAECEFYFIVQEKTEPYAIQIYLAGKEMIDLGKRKINKALKNYFEADLNNDWEKAYENTVLTLEPPRWALNQV